MKKLKPCYDKRPPLLGKFSPHAHPFVEFIWRDIIDRKLSLTSVAQAAGIDRSTMHKWRNAHKGPYLLQLTEVLTVLGYELKIVKVGEADDNSPDA